jgi:C_GCAxxG_C_C family probable redox protein
MTHIEKSQELFAKKFHCSQAVLAAFAEELGLTEKQALKLGACFGGGMCKGEVCGACTGALMALGLKFGQCEVGDTDSKEKTNDITVKFLEAFKDKNGSYMCRELLGCDLATLDGKLYAREHNLFTKFCPKMVTSATEIAEKLLLENK